MTEATFQWRRGFEGHGTTHEKLGQKHFPHAEFTEYKSRSNYTKGPRYAALVMQPIYNFTHYLFSFIQSDEELPPGYLEVTDSETIALGPQAQNNDWRDLLARYWMVLIWVIFLLTLIIIMPFAACCYCCFCCCRRCPKEGTPSSRKMDTIERYGWSCLLVLLILGILFGVIIAFATNRLMDRGFDYTRVAAKHCSEDTCTYLREVSSHLQHLLVSNYEEMDTHLGDTLTNAYKHIFLDLMDVSEANAVFDLERILDNMEEARNLLREVDTLQKDLRFYGAQLRDGLRGVKRDVYFACAVMCGNQQCLRFLEVTHIARLDASKCLHFDQLPDIEPYLKAMESIMAQNKAKAVKEVIQRLQVISDLVEASLEPLIQPLIRDIHLGREMYLNQAKSMENIVDLIIKDIHLNTLKSIATFDGIYDKFGADRNMINVIVCCLISIIAIALIMALICGCCSSSRCGCNKDKGVSILLFAIMLIFCVFSFVVLLGLFYFVLGLITYLGACAPFPEFKYITFFRQLDPAININRYLPKSQQKLGKSLPILRMSTAIKACRSNHSIFRLLQDNNLYDINGIVRFQVIGQLPTVHLFPNNLVNFTMFSEQDSRDLEDLRKDLSNYQSTLFTDFLCHKLTPVDLPTMANQLRQLRTVLYTQWNVYEWARTSLYNEALNLQRYHDEFIGKIKTIIDKMTHKLLKIDALILYNGLPFNKSIEILLEATKRSEKFININGERFVNVLFDNLTSYVNNEIAEYVKMVIDKCHTSAGRCAPLARIYDNGIDLICHRLVDPMNAFWFGLVLCALLLVPVLCVAHRLMCLNKKDYLLETPSAESGLTFCPYSRHFFGPESSYFHRNDTNENRYRAGNDTVEQENTSDTVKESSNDVSKHKQE